MDAAPKAPFASLDFGAERRSQALHKEESAAGRAVGHPVVGTTLTDMLEPPGNDDGGHGAAVEETKAPRSARQLPSTRPWNPLRQARSGMLRWKPKV